MKYININKQIVDTELDPEFDAGYIASDREEFELGRFIELTPELEELVNNDPEFDILNYAFPESIPEQPKPLYYVSKHRIIKTYTPLNSRNWNIGETAKDLLDGAFILMTDEQAEWYEANPTATPFEAFNMTFDLVPTKAKKLEALMEYDSSDSVNSFTVNGLEAWLTVPERANYNTSISAAELLGHETVTFMIAGQVLTVPTLQAKQMLAAVQLYADACYIVTQSHAANINELVDVDEVMAYDFTTGYPEKLTFTIE